METPALVCLSLGKKKIYMRTIVLACQYVDAAGRTVRTEGEVLDGNYAEYAAAPCGSFAVQNGKVSGEYLYFSTDTGEVLARENWSDGKLSGERNEYYPGGTLLRQENYSNGVLDGPAKEYYPDGSLRYEEEYSAGALVSVKENPKRHQTADVSPRKETVQAPPQKEPQPPAQAVQEASAVPAAEPAPKQEEKGPALTAGEVLRRTEANIRIYYLNGKEVARETLGRNSVVVSITGKIPDGIVKEFHANGQLKVEETYLDGKLNGLRKKYDELGRIWAEEHYQNNMLEGQVRIHNYFKDKVFEEEATFSANRLNGLRKTFYPNGKISVEETYKDGKLEGIRRSYYEDGPINTEETYKDDRLNGPRMRYYDNGKLWNSEHYMEGRLHGVRKDYYISGQVRLEEKYENGRLEGVKTFYYDNGKPMYEEVYSGGKLVERRENKTKNG